MTIEALAPLYLWTKSLHLLAVFAWMAGLFYLPRLYVYHTDAAPGSDTSALFMVMERRLLRGIMNPAMIAAWLLGLTLVLTPGVVQWDMGWWYGKAAGFLGMTAFHMHLAGARGAFARDERRHTGRYWRMLNEAPTLLLALIVLMVIVKPF